MTDIDKLLEERGKVHGDFTERALIAQSLKSIVRDCPNWEDLSCTQAEALEMIAHKISRILAGNPNVKDHWDDIAGYARLVSMRLEK